MYNLSDVIKNSFLEEFSEISIQSLLTSIILSFILSCFILLVYRITYRGVLFNRNFALSLPLLAMVTSLVILTVSSNVVLSLGMVGALSIVRFRTAVKDPMDTIYMFWAIVAGITTGAGLVSIAIIATLTIGLIFLLLNLMGNGFSESSYLVIIRYSSAISGDVANAIKKMPKSRVKSRTCSGENEEIVLEARLNDNTRKLFDRIKTMEGVTEVNLVSYNGSTLL